MTKGPPICLLGFRDQDSRFASLRQFIIEAQIAPECYLFDSEASLVSYAAAHVKMVPVFRTALSCRSEVTLCSLALGLRLSARSLTSSLNTKLRTSLAQFGGLYNISGYMGNETW
ncbi:hypothetical protein WG66_007348 [Moniliophthora roreri]|nr:hypothetical protein WG66_007348 [Moniliophthora roreri]